MRLFGEIAAVPSLRYAISSWGLSVVAEAAMLVALLVVAYDVGGPAVVAAFSALRAAPVLVIGPVLIGRSDRGARERWLLAVLLTRVALVFSAVVALLAGRALVALVVGGLASVLFTTHRPMNAALLPYLARTPAQLTASNASSAVVEGAGTLLGPALAGALLLVGEPALVLAAAAGLLGAAAWCVALVRDVPRAASAPEPLTFGSAVRDFAEGLDALRRPPFVLALTSAQTFARGVLLVAVVVLAVDVLGQGDPGVGWLSAMMGLGGMVGGLVAVTLVTSTRLARGLASGVAMWGLPMVVVGLWTTPAVAFAAFALIGFGNAFVDVGVFTLVARLVKPAVLGRAFAAFEVVIVLSVTAGSLVAGAAIPRVGAPAVLATAGAVLVIGSGASWAATRVVDRSLEPGPHVRTLRSCAALTRLPLVSIEYLASVGEERGYAGGTPVMRQGEPGEEFHVVVSGAATVELDGRTVATLGPGDGFGEIALLRDVPRTASVVAANELRTLSVRRGDFLTFVAGHPAAAAAVTDMAAGRETANARRRHRS